MFKPNENCPDCKGDGKILLLTSIVDCDCMKPKKIYGKAYIKIGDETIDASIGAASSFQCIDQKWIDKLLANGWEYKDEIFYEAWKNRYEMWQVDMDVMKEIYKRYWWHIDRCWIDRKEQCALGKGLSTGQVLGYPGG